MVGPEMTAQAVDLARQDAQAIEHKLETSGVLEGLSHRVEVRDGDVWEELQSVIERERTDLVVVGTHSRTGLAKVVLGSVAERIFRQATCPVLTVGQRAPAIPQVAPSERLRPLLFPTDLGEGSLKALPYALSLANRRKTRVALMHALCPIPEQLDNRWHTAEDVIGMRLQAQVRAVAHLKSLVRDVELEVKPITIVEFGDPAEWILRKSKEVEAEAIVMGLNHTTHLGGISHFPWSTAYKVACGAACPVLTFRY